jgi:hypothetical protein
LSRPASPLSRGHAPLAAAALLYVAALLLAAGDAARAPPGGDGGDPRTPAPPPAAAPAGPSATTSGAPYEESPFPKPTLSREFIRQACVDCHREGRPGLVAAHEAGVHARKGVSCADCHGMDHSTIFGKLGRVSAATCGGCHPKAAADFATSAHARAHDGMLADRRFEEAGPAAREACIQCHEIGRRDPGDGSVGLCNKCHVGHEFRRESARNPEACAGCHSGPHHPQAEAYSASKHGVAWAASRDERRAPSCATCHMPGGAHGRDPIISIGGTLHGSRVEGDARHPGPPYAQPAIPTAAAALAREAALEGCMRCHARRVAADALARADEVKREADRVLASAARAILAARSAEGAPAPRLGPGQTSTDGGALERRFHEAFRHRGPSAWKGAYHGSPGHAFAEGLEPLAAIGREVEEAAAAALERARGAAGRPARGAAAPPEGAEGAERSGGGGGGT